ERLPGLQALGAGVDPGADERDVRVAQLFAFLGRRHEGLRLVLDLLDEQALRGLAGYEGGAGLADLQQALVSLEVELALHLLGVVAAAAVLREDFVDLREGGRLRLLLRSRIHPGDPESAEDRQEVSDVFCHAHQWLKRNSLLLRMPQKRSSTASRRLASFASARSARSFSFSSAAG